MIVETIRINTEDVRPNTLSIVKGELDDLKAKGSQILGAQECFEG